jgi:3-oxoacyl-[acyl-carrier protein] reductase
LDLKLENKRVLITGSTRGIGLAIAEHFLGENCNVAITGRNSEILKIVQKKLSSRYPERVLGLTCDFKVQERVIELEHAIMMAWGGLDILVVNVGNGISLPDPIPPNENFETVMRVNFDSVVYTARTFLPLIRKTSGNILFISSIAGLEAIGAPVDYSVAKSAVISFAKNLSRKVAIDRVRVNCIAPGNIFFKDGRWEELIKENPEKVEQMLEISVPMKRFGTPEEIADAALYLCSERASFVTGAILTVDGGQTVRTG